MPKDTATPQASPAGRGFGYIYNQVADARIAAAELESMLDNGDAVLSLAGAASALEDRFCELRCKLYQIAEAIDS